MKRAQLIGVTIALGAGIFAFAGMRFLINKGPITVVKKETIGATEVLVASAQLPIGMVAGPQHFRWMNWPADAVSKTYITRKEKPMAIQELAGGVARSTINKDEPITDVKLVAVGQGGVLAAILPKGKRAVSTKIADATAAGRLILPNDHVDVLVTVERGGRFDTTTLLRNIRVLAIGKPLDVSNKEKGANGNVATLELSPRQAEQMALANSMGRISLALRSVADIQANKSQNENKPERSEQSTSVQIFQYGIKGRAY